MIQSTAHKIKNKVTSAATVDKGAAGKNTEPLSKSQSLNSLICSSTAAICLFPFQFHRPSVSSSISLDLWYCKKVPFCFLFPFSVIGFISFTLQSRHLIHFHYSPACFIHLKTRYKRWYRQFLGYRKGPQSPCLLWLILHPKKKSKRWFGLGFWIKGKSFIAYKVFVLFSLWESSFILLVLICTQWGGWQWGQWWRYGC